MTPYVRDLSLSGVLYLNERERERGCCAVFAGRICNWPRNMTRAAVQTCKMGCEKTQRRSRERCAPVQASDCVWVFIYLLRAWASRALLLYLNGGLAAAQTFVAAAPGSDVAAALVIPVARAGGDNLMNSLEVS
jgi:hypothetical protein